MTRRPFLSILASFAAVAAPLVSAAWRVWRRWPFVEIHQVTRIDEAHSITGEPQVAWTLTYCDICNESAAHGNRKFYRTTDGSELVVCERCTGEYLRENGQ